MTDIPSKPYVRYGVHSEVGTLRKVLVCSPGLAHTRLTPTNCDELLFDDVLWVQNAKRDHFDFVAKMRERGVEVVEKHTTRIAARIDQNVLTLTLPKAESVKPRKIVVD
jgi:arginine deiminase